MKSKLLQALRIAAILAFSALTGSVLCALAWLSGHKGLPAGRFPLFTAAVWARMEMQLIFVAAFALCLLMVRAFLRGQPARHFSVWKLLLALFYAGTYLIGFALQHQKGPGVYLLLGGKPAFGLIAADAAAVFYMLIELADRALDALQPRLHPAADDAAADRRFFLIACGVLAAAWLPYALMCLPGTFTKDARVQWAQFRGILPWSNDNPVLDTVIFGALLDLGGCTAVVFFQYALFVLAFAYCAQTVRRLTGSPKAAWILLVFFALNPVLGEAIQYIVKDSLHMPFVVLLFSLLARILFSQKPRRRDYVCYVLLFILAALSRKAALTYVAAAGLLASLLPKCKKPLLACTAGALAFVLSFNYLLLPALGVGEAKQKASLPVFLQVIGYTACNASLTAEEAAETDRILGLDALRAAFNSDNSDEMKNRLLPDDTETAQTAEVMQLALRLARNHPKQAVMAILSAYWKYYFPQSPGTAYSQRNYVSDYLSESIPVVSFRFPQANALVDRALRELTNTPFVSLLFGSGAYVWVLGFVLVRILRRRQTRLLPLALPMLVLAAGFLLTPINGMTRYAYPLIATVPFTAMLTAFTPAPDR